MNFAVIKTALVDLASLTLIAASLLFAYWFFIDTDYPVVNMDAKIAPMKVEPGQTFYVERNFDRVRSCETSVISEFVDSGGIRYLLNRSANTIPGPVENDISRTFTYKVPRGATLGPATYETTITYKCNPLHVGIQKFKDLEVEVVAPAE